MLSFFNQFSFFYILNIMTNMSLPMLIMFSFFMMLNTKKMYLNSNMYIISNFMSNNLFSKDMLEFGLKTSSMKKVYMSEVMNNDKFNYVLDQSMDSKIGEKVNTHGYYTLVNGLFLFVLFMNIMGMFPYFFSMTTHVSMTIGMSLTMVMYCLFNSMMFHFDHFFSSFTPQNSPLMLAPLLSLMETMSFFASMMSLGVSLAANMCAGHLLMSMMSMFGYACTLSYYWFMISWIPSMLLMFVMLLEMCVSFIQSYMFMVLSMMYMEESFNINDNHMITGMESVMIQNFNKMKNIDKLD